MKIAIVSMHRVKNNGSFLQAYALYEKIKTYGHEVEFGDFDDEKHKEIVIKNQSIIKRIYKKISSFIDSTYRKNVQISKKSFEFIRRSN